MRKSIKHYREMKQAKNRVLSTVGAKYWSAGSEELLRRCKKSLIGQAVFWLVAICVIVLLLVLALIAPAQELISADKATWKRVAVGHPNTEKKFNLYVQTPIGGGKFYPVVRARHDTGPIATLTLDCKAGEFRYHQPDAEWIKAPKGSVGAALLKFACK